MSNQRSFYFGAYLRVVLNSVMKQPKKWVCDAHGTSAYEAGHYCSVCGNALERLPEVETYPSWYEIEQELPEQYYEQMRELTHHKAKDNVIYLCGNTIDDGETWLYLGANKYDDIEQKTKPFPSELEMESMIQSLQKNHAGLIEELKNHPSVRRVMYSCGFVLDEDI